jgi:hypothetical protein
MSALAATVRAFGPCEWCGDPGEARDLHAGAVVLCDACIASPPSLHEDLDDEDAQQEARYAGIAEGLR